MTNELEKQFFDTFGIEPKEFKYDIGIWNNELNCCEEHIITIPYVHYNNYSRCPSRDKGFIYPQISDRILLGIIAKIMWSYSCTQNDFDAYEVYTVDNLKEAVLKHAIELSKNDAYVYTQVRTLFEESKNEISKVV